MKLVTFPQLCAALVAMPFASAALAATPPPYAPIQPGDVRLQVDAANTFASYRWLWGVECDGQVQGAIHIPETGIVGSALPGVGTLRFGKTPDPDNPNRKVLLFRASPNDGLSAGAPRCEMTFSPSFSSALPRGQDFWFAFGMRLVDWQVGADEQILSQWHQSDGSIAVGPFFALALYGNKLQIDMKYNTNPAPSAATTISKVLWQDADLPINKWTYFVVKAKISQVATDNPYIQVWRDGNQVVDYKGPVGYNYAVQPYAKVGHYQWVANYNPWSVPYKTVLYRAPSLISDTQRRYTAPQVQNFVSSH